MRSRAPADAGSQPAGAPSLRSFRMLHLYRCQQGFPLLPAGYHGISPVEIYKPLCGAIEVAPQGGFIVRRGEAIPIREGMRMALSLIKSLPQGGRQRGGSFAASKESQPRLAVLGSPFQGKGLAWRLPPSSGRRCPEGAEVGWGKRYEKERGRSSQVRRLRKYPIHRWRGPPSPMGKATIREYRYSRHKAFPAWGRWRAERAG